MRVDVISVATPKGLFRAICPTFQGNTKEMVDALVKCIGLTNLKETEWRGAIYIMPDYLFPERDSRFPERDSRREYPEGGIFLYPWVTGHQKSSRNPNAEPQKYGHQESIWNDPKHRWTLSSHREFIMRPNGWIKGGPRG